MLRISRSILLFVMLVATAALFLMVSWTNMDYVRSNVIQMTQVAECVTSHSKQHWPCIDRKAWLFNRVEDIFCIALPEFIPYLKNPCFYDYGINSTELRCLPYFYIIGMDKCGTTDLHSRIAQHPFVMGNKGSLGKETEFWSWQRYGVFNKRTGLPKSSLEDYINMFAETALLIKETNTTQIITGDASPMDFWDFRSWNQIPQNKNSKEPGVLTPNLLQFIHKDRAPKLIIQFREPIERLYSDYIFLEYGTNPEQFHKHVLEAISLVDACMANNTRRFCYFSQELYQALPARVHLGCYSVFLKEWFSVFPRSSFLITTMDEYSNFTENTLDKVFKFLDLPLLPEFKMAEILNQTRRHVTQNKSGVILPKTVDALQKFYAPCNKEAADLTGDNRFLWLDHFV